MENKEKPMQVEVTKRTHPYYETDVPGIFKRARNRVRFLTNAKSGLCAGELVLKNVRGLDYKA